MKNKYFLLILIVFGLTLSSCIQDKNSPGYAYMGEHDMYYTKFYKAYTPNPILPNGQTNQPSPEGSISRAQSFYPFHPTTIVEKVTGQKKAGEELTNPVKANDKNLLEGKRQFDIFCSDCHGINGKGDGHLYTAKLFPAKPRDLTGSYVQSMPDGSIFFIITEGSISGLMGPHGVQITPENRWKIINYIRTFGKNQ